LSGVCGGQPLTKEERPITALIRSPALGLEVVLVKFCKFEWDRLDL